MGSGRKTSQDEDPDLRLELRCGQWCPCVRAGCLQPLHCTRGSCASGRQLHLQVPVETCRARSRAAPTLLSLSAGGPLARTTSSSLPQMLLYSAMRAAALRETWSRHSHTLQQGPTGPACLTALRCAPH